ncbi:hypothetical protein HR52_07450 [Aeromonas hydrophila]|nr:hypothetical protein HR52_07450 [Aeromonas hydrophila]OCY05870.1 hypothetical protein A9X69_14325 [Aeromonas hydrophila]OCY11279.1 hypothetical protein A9X70_00400 [Aeromonas hydrophila]
MRFLKNPQIYNKTISCVDMMIMVNKGALNQPKEDKNDLLLTLSMPRWQLINVLSYGMAVVALPKPMSTITIFYLDEQYTSSRILLVLSM